MAPGKLVAGVFALAAFAIAIVSGLSAGNPPTRILTAALVSMVICHALGLCLGAIGEKVVGEHLAKYRAGSASGGARGSKKEAAPASGAAAA